MTLEEAIAELRGLTPADEVDAQVIPVIFAAIRSGKLIPATDACPLVVADLGELFSEAQATAGEPVTASQIIAIGGGGGHPDHATDARLAVALAYQRALTAIAELPTPKDEAVMIGHEEAYRAVERIVPTDALAEVHLRGAPTPVGLFAALTDEQQRQALAFRGNPDFGPVETAEAKVTRLVEAMERRAGNE